MKLLILALVWSNILHAQILSTSEAKNHIGENTTVCGSVKGAYYARNMNGAPTFINLDGSYPNQPFNIVIWASSRVAFKTGPENYYTGKRLCITGSIKEHKGIPNIEATSPSQIRIEGKK